MMMASGINGIAELAEAAAAMTLDCGSHHVCVLQLTGC